ncbi:MAG: hypothetical protein LBE34_00060 [Flavobacteriaceae bacterium]|jgi:hypothetical protein|nr:hypothetical protein [Flavobacteriaceae bacterium]
MKKIFVFIFLFVNIEFIFSQIHKYDELTEIDIEIQKYLLERREIDIISDNNYILFSFFKKTSQVNFENENCFIIRVGCSVCYDYILFKNKTEFEIVDLNNLDVLVQSAGYFLKEESDARFRKYLNKITKKYEDNIKVKNIRNKKLIIVKSQQKVEN